MMAVTSFSMTSVLIPDGKIWFLIPNLVQRLLVTCLLLFLYGCLSICLSVYLFASVRVAISGLLLHVIMGYPAPFYSPFTDTVTSRTLTLDHYTNTFLAPPIPCHIQPSIILNQQSLYSFLPNSDANDTLTNCPPKGFLFYRIDLLPTTSYQPGESIYLN